MDVDDCISNVVGNFGKYQIMVFSVLSMSVISAAGLILLLVFIGENPAKLKLFNFRVNNESSILTEWNLLDETWVIDMTQALFFGGFLFGVVIFGQLSDRFGRRIIMISGFSILLPLSFLSSFSSSLLMFAICRFLIGLICGGVQLVQFIYLQEMVGRSWWAVTGSVQGTIFAVGIVLMVLGAYLSSSWRQLIRLISIIQIPPLICTMFFPESPRWLYSKGYISRAEKVLDFVAKRNGVKQPACKLKEPDMEGLKRSYTLIDLLRNSVTAKRAAVMSFLWFVNCMVYYAFTQAAGELADNTYISEALSGLIEIPSIALSPILMNKRWCGRRLGVAVPMLLAGFSCLLLMAFDPEENAAGKLALGLLGKLSVTFSFNVVYVYAPELFPTVVRNVALGCMSMFARVGGIISSFAKTSITSHPMMSYFGFGSCAIAAGLLSLLLPETLGNKPPNSFEDLNPATLRSTHDSAATYMPLDSSRFRNKSVEDTEGLLQNEDDNLL